jgi:hypothetical protein
MTTIIDNSLVQVRYCKAFLYITYRTGTVIDLMEAILVVSERMAVQNDSSPLVLCDISGIQGITKTGRNYLANGGSSLISALAILAPTILTSGKALFYLKTTPPPFPTRIFQEKDAAITFLNNMPQIVR